MVDVLLWIWITLGSKTTVYCTYYHPSTNGRLHHVQNRNRRWLMSGINRQLLLYCLGAHIYFLSLRDTIL
jgi:hypothetical protein